LLKRTQPDALLLDVMLPGMTGLELFQRVRRLDERIPVIFITAGGESDDAIEAMKLGALDFLLKPLNVDRVRQLVGQALEIRRLMETPVELPTNTHAEGSEHQLIGRSPAMMEVYKAVGRVAPQTVTVLIRGESGTGKEVIARAIYQHSERRDKPFLAVNCAALPDALLESELFGHARGSFTGAFRDKTGLVEEASGGTFFLDEIGDLPLALQSKLLRVLEERKVRRVGENRPRSVDVRFVSATNKDLDHEVERGRFRQDLYYRLKIIAIDLPPLRERPDDALLLLNHFLDEFSRTMDRPRPFVSPVALELLLHYPWPGNVRELQNEVQRCLVMAGGGPLILEDHLSPKINPAGETYSRVSHRFAEAKADFEKRFLREALARCRYHRTRTAAEVGLTRQGLFKLLKKHGIGARTSPAG
ncbi:MAG: sigma-54-dependent transcriptional regulator, partial [Candidatus Aminicenantales bacterium]